MPDNYVFLGAYCEVVREGDLVLFDHFYGAEEVVKVESRNTPEAVAIRFTLRRPERGADPGGTRYALRYQREVCIRAIGVSPDAARAIQQHALDVQAEERTPQPVLSY